ncbi:MAG TPA: hypothetical protein VLH79_06705 [Chthonomonadales bacterium]|nr:hypothetical protein [Chthonomonadales bacterium]
MPQCLLRLPRRLFLRLLLAPLAAAPARAQEGGRPAPRRASTEHWWMCGPTFIQTEDPRLFVTSGAVMVIHGFGADPTWGPFGQQLRFVEAREAFDAIRAAGGRVITYFEGFGDSMAYAAAFERRADGAFTEVAGHPGLARVVRNHWNWTSADTPLGNAVRWVGIHNVTNREDFVAPVARRLRWTLPAPRYPDGTAATGWVPGRPYPLNARVYDACGSKNLNGDLDPHFERVAGMGPEDIRPDRAEGLLTARPGVDDVAAAPGAPDRPVLCGVANIHKDLSAPFWLEAARWSVREMARRGLDGIWCDNFSPWDNFGYPPVRRAFGDWSIHRFAHEYLPSLPARSLLAMGAASARSVDLRARLRDTAQRFGARDARKLDDPAWSDARWLDDPLWCAYKAFRQERARRDLAAFDRTIHQAAAEAGRPDFLVAANDTPLYGLGWVRPAWLDMVNTEVTPGWHMGTGSRGVMLPPVGKMAVVYRAGLAHQRARRMGAWYYLDGPHASRQGKPNVGRLLCAEAHANGAVLLCDAGIPRVAGTIASHAAWNAFLAESAGVHRERAPRATIGVAFSPDCQLGLLAPGGFPDLDRQPHVFGHWGWGTALIDAHLTYRVVADWNLTNHGLAGLSVLLLPDVDCLAPAAAAAIERWVRGGGRLVATGPCGERHGPSGRFERRPRPWIAGLMGGDGEAASRKHGVGSIAWTPEPLGMRYWLEHDGRPALLPELLRLAGLEDRSGLPPMVGAFEWQDPQGSAVHVDLVNYDLDRSNDIVRPVGPLEWRTALPQDWEGVQCRTVSPEAVAASVVEVRDGLATLRLPRLEYYASVLLCPSAETGA